MAKKTRDLARGGALENVADGVETASAGLGASCRKSV